VHLNSRLALNSEDLSSGCDHLTSVLRNLTPDTRLRFRSLAPKREAANARNLRQRTFTKLAQVFAALTDIIYIP
jgi:hypothetical protein